MVISNEHIIDRTQNWIRLFIIKLNVCPFAKREIEKNTVKIHVVNAQKLQQALEALSLELLFLDKNPSMETTFLVFPSLFTDFFHYLDFLAVAESLIIALGYEGIYQLASFHPDYCFADTEFNDVSNYTNRSPYPMIHLLREESLEKAINYYGDTERIPTNNIATMRQIGLKQIEEIWAKL